KDDGCKTHERSSVTSVSNFHRRDLPDRATDGQAYCCSSLILSSPLPEESELLSSHLLLGITFFLQLTEKPRRPTLDHASGWKKILRRCLLRRWTRNARVWPNKCRTQVAAVRLRRSSHHLQSLRRHAQPVECRWAFTQMGVHDGQWYRHCPAQWPRSR